MHVEVEDGLPGGIINYTNIIPNITYIAGILLYMAYLSSKCIFWEGIAMSEKFQSQFGGKWTDEKLAILQNYLQAYVTALKNQNFYTFTLMHLPELVIEKKKNTDLQVSNHFLHILG